MSDIAAADIEQPAQIVRIAHDQPVAEPVDGERHGVEPQVALLDARQARFDHVLVAVIRQKLDKASMGQAEDGLVVPKGVVGVQADGGDGHAASL